jgi:hypothetical protein
VCYHNLRGIADYGEYGHGEVVGMSIPTSAVPAFAKEYIGLFGDDGDRPDKVNPRLALNDKCNICFTLYARTAANVYSDKYY